MPARPLLGVVFALLMQNPPGLSTALAAGTAAEVCAPHDLIVFSLIEQHGKDQSLAAEIVADAAMKLLDARVACRDGREAEAMAIYADLSTRLAATAGRR